MRMSLTPQIKLQIALQFLATGDSYKLLQYLYRLSKSAISMFIPDVFDAIYEGLQEYIQVKKILQFKMKQIVLPVFCLLLLLNNKYITK